jgi:BirA family biotin operon repressor/biotin-[acetyl-CoA-carboxylase] ligase
METAPIGPLPAELQRYLVTDRLGRRVYLYPETDSTNDVALALARAGEPEGTLVVTDHQRRGRGRRSHTWTSPPGKDILGSIILRPPCEMREALAVTLVVATGIAVALSRLLDADHRVKWPNDVLSPAGKIAGILAESSGSSGRVEFLVVGIGINVNSGPGDWPESWRASAASCHSITGVPWERPLVLADVLGAVEAWYDRFRRDGFGPLVGAYEQRLLQLGRAVAFERGGKRWTGVATGVAADGALRVQLDSDGSTAELYGESAEVIG